MNKDEYIEQLKYNLKIYIEKCTMYENSNRDFIEDIKELKERISKAIEYIEDNFTNEDRTIWHEEIREIYNILKGE